MPARDRRQARPAAPALPVRWRRAAAPGSAARPSAASERDGAEGAAAYADDIDDPVGHDDDLSRLASLQEALNRLSAQAPLARPRHCGLSTATVSSARFLPLTCTGSSTVSTWSRSGSDLRPCASRRPGPSRPRMCQHSSARCGIIGANIMTSVSQPSRSAQPKSGAPLPLAPRREHVGQLVKLRARRG